MAEAAHRKPVQLPYRLLNHPAMGIDQAVPSFIKPGEMNLLDRVGRHRIEVSGGIETMIDGIDVDVIDVEQQAAAGAPAQLIEKFRLRNGLVAEPDVSRNVLDQDAPLQARLHLIDAIAYQRERFLRTRQRQQFVQVSPADRTPAQVFRYQKRVITPDKPFKRIEVSFVERIA